ncbi:MAG: outer membrane beta-barrel protein [Bacteroidaceae bacterium]|nr:outer membrane beta-barrel protein [Bacteroidaceae bacterium]
MKKIILSAIVAVASLSASAQVYLGGTVGFNSSKIADGADNVTSFTIAPEIGYMFNEKWGVGLAIGYQTSNGSFDANGWSAQAKKSEKSNGAFAIAPYARFVFAKTGIASFFLDGGIGMQFMNNSRGNIFQVGIRPGVKLSASEKVDFVAQLGTLGYAWASEKAGKGNAFGIGVDNTAVNFGVYYNF